MIELNIPTSNVPRIVVIGGGFAGIELVKKLRKQPYQVVLLDQHNFFTFQPLLYQVATAGLEANSVAYPLRRLVRNSRNVHFRVAKVRGVAPEAKRLFTSLGEMTYDYLVLATGSRSKFFGLDKDCLLPLKTVTGALDIRNHLLSAFERALTQKSEEGRDLHMNIVVVGGGPTGVEMAGALGEMKRFILPEDYPELDISSMEVHLVEGLDRLLTGMSDASDADARRYLENLGVKVHLNTMIEEYDGKSVKLKDMIVPTRNLIWTAGVEAAPIDGLAEAQQKNKRIRVNEFLQVEGFDNIFAIGDVMYLPTDAFPNGLPMLAPVAIQQGQYLGRYFKKLNGNQDRTPFRYFDKGTMATVGRNRAVADMGKLHLRGFLAWLTWMFVHLMYLVGFRNKLVTLLNWIYSYFTYDKALRLIIPKTSWQKQEESEDSALVLSEMTSD